MKINDIETSRLLLRGFTKEDALWAYSIWNNPEMGQYLPDEAKEEIDAEYLKMLEGLGEDEECCYLFYALFAVVHHACTQDFPSHCAKSFPLCRAKAAERKKGRSLIAAAFLGLECYIRSSSL